MLCKVKLHGIFELFLIKLVVIGFERQFWRQNICGFQWYDQVAARIAVPEYRCYSPWPHLTLQWKALIYGGVERPRPAGEPAVGPDPGHLVWAPTCSSLGRQRRPRAMRRRTTRKRSSGRLWRSCLLMIVFGRPSFKRALEAELCTRKSMSPKSGMSSGGRSLTTCCGSRMKTTRGSWWSSAIA